MSKLGALSKFIRFRVWLYIMFSAFYRLRLKFNGYFKNEISCTTS